MKAGKKTEKKTLENTPPVKENEVKKTKIKVIGLGGGGNSIVSEIADKISKANFTVADTDAKSLRGCSKKLSRFQFGQSLTGGMGTGMNPQMGREVATAEKEKIKKLCQGQDLCILVASLGGGTASGAVSAFAKASKDSGNLTYGIFTLPFSFEGERKMEIATEALKEAKSYFNAITIIPNERVFQIIDKETPLKEALSAVNKFLSANLQGLIETIYEPGLINIDFADFRTIMEGLGKIAYLNAETVELKKKGENRLGEDEAVEAIISKTLNSPLYPYTIKGAKGILLNIIGEKNLSLSGVNRVSKAISEIVDRDAKIIFGVSQNKKYSSSIKTVLLATGCDKDVKMPTPEQTAEKSQEDGEKKELVRKSLTTSQKKPVKKAKKLKKKESQNKKTNTVKKDIPVSLPVKRDKVRKNALQVKKEVEEMEKEILEKEKYWEVPAFLRKKAN